MAPPDNATHRQLEAVLRRYLSPAVASLLAEPVRTEDGLHIDWFTTLSGQPVPLGSLPAEEQRRLRRVLDDRIQAIQQLAQRLPAVEPGTQLVPTLLRATTYPGEEAVFAVNGQPVLIFWGYGELPPERAPEAAPVTGRTSRLRAVVLALLALLLLGGLVWGGVLFSLIPWPFSNADQAALLEAERREGERLRTLLVSRQSDLVAAFTQCNQRSTLDLLKQEAQILNGRSDTLLGDLRDALQRCKALQERAAAEDEHRSLAERLQKLRTELETQRAKCGGKLLNAVEQETRKLRTRVAVLHRKLAAKLKQCSSPKPVPPPAPTPAKPPPPPPPPATPAPSPQPAEKPAAALPPCPGERPPEDAPDVAIVLDASGSMGIPAVLDPESTQIVRQFEQCMAGGGVLGPIVCAGLAAGYEALMNSRQGPNRLQAAQQAVNSVVSNLPRDVDVGLAVLEDCPRANDYGLFDASRRATLLQTINSLTPRRGTPLADGLRQGARLVDGVHAPAVMVVVSDGKDSCGQDPCATAAALKASKPKLKINVVDIVGDGAVNCIARATGGDVLTPRSGMSLDQLVKKAARDAAKPEHCK